MTSEEMRKVAVIALSADGGCHVCAGALFDQLNRTFPGHLETPKAAWREELPGREYDPDVGDDQA